MRTVAGDPIEPRHYAELDHCFSNTQALNAVKNVVVRPEYCGFSNHFLLQIEISIRMNPRRPPPPLPLRRITHCWRTMSAGGGLLSTSLIICRIPVCVGVA